MHTTTLSTAPLLDVVAAPAPALPHAQVTCPRCGSFAHEIDESYELCAPCMLRALPEPVRGGSSLGTVASGVAHVLRAVGGRALCLAVVFALPGVLAAAFLPRELAIVSWLLSSFVGAFGTLAVLVLSREALLGREVSVGEALGRGADGWGRVVWTSFLVGLFVGLWSILLVIPGVFAAASYTLALPIALFEARSGTDAIDRSRQRMKGSIGLAIGLLVVTGLATYVAQILGVLAAMSMGAESELQALAAGIFGAPVLMLSTIVSQVLYEQRTIASRVEVVPSVD